MLEFFESLPTSIHILAYAVLAALTHGIVIVIQRVANWSLSKGTTRRFAKLRTIGTLVTSIVVFSLYFLAGGFILAEMGVSLTAYLASASIVGLAIGFGSQGVVQDVVTGITLIFSDLIDVGDLVEVSGQTGIVKAITMRFIELRNAMGASVFIPNRTINNVINYPRGYVRCIVDVTLLGDDEEQRAAERVATTLMTGIYEQFPGILITEPSIEGRLHLQSGRELLRIKYRIWPNRGQPIETVYVQELLAQLQEMNPAYESWMISVTYEIEKKATQP
ncbi:MAG: mechanosensitive ion channel [Gammaproteobacteria bacterium]|jgi:small conductance mechanosensitive channel